MDSFTVMHDGTGDHLHIPLGAGVAITATVIPVIHRVLGRDTRLGTRLIIESNGVTGKGMAFRRAAPFDPEILLSRRRETVEWASAAIVTALEQLAGVANDIPDPTREESNTELRTLESNQEPAPATDDTALTSLAFPSALRDSLHPVTAELATLSGHITQLDSVIWEMYGAIEELRTEMTKAVRSQEPDASPTVDNSTPPIATLQPTTGPHIEATSIHHLAPADVMNLRKSIANPIHALDFIRQQRVSASQTTTFDSSFDTWEAIVLVASGKQHEAAHLAGTIVWQGDPDAAFALIVICLTAGRLPQPVEAIVDTSSALIARKVQALTIAARNVSHEDKVAFLSVLSSKVAKSTALALANDMLASASKVEEAEVLLAVGAIDEKRAVDEYSLRFESMSSEAAYNIGLTLLKGLQEYGHGRKLIALLVSCANAPGDPASSERLSEIIVSSPTVELAARSAEAIVLSIPRPERNEALQHAIGLAIKNGLNSPLRTNGPFVTSCRLFVSQIQEVDQLAELAESISALLAHGAPEPVARVPESATERDRRILAARKVVVVGGFPPRWLEEIEDLGCDVKWFQSEVKARPPLEAIFHAATDADIVIVDRRVSHATTIPLRVFVRQRRIPIQDFVERNKGRFLDLLRNRFG